jgi:hypothetical protein
VQEDDIGIDALVVQLTQQVGKSVQVVPAIPRIDADREVLRCVAATAPNFIHRSEQQAGRQVVDTVIPEVFEDVEGNGLSRS